MTLESARSRTLTIDCVRSGGEGGEERNEGAGKICIGGEASRTRLQHFVWNRLERQCALIRGGHA